MKRHALWGFITAALLTMLAPGVAIACSCTGAPPVIYADGQTIPADFGGVAIWLGGIQFDDAVVEVERWVDGTWVSETADVVTTSEPQLPFHWGLVLVKPAPFEEGDRFRIRLSAAQFRDPFEAEVDVGPPLPVVAGQPKLVLGDHEVLTTEVEAGSSCDQPALVAARAVDIELPGELEPFRDLLLYETTVNGIRWHPQRSLCREDAFGRSWQDAPGTDLIATVCASRYGEFNEGLLADGSHTVQVHAFFPGTTHPVWSTPAVQTDVTCPSDSVEYDYELDDFVPCPAADDVGTVGGTDMGRDLVDAAASSGDDNTGGGCSTTTGSSLFPTLLIALYVFRVRRRE